MRLLVSINSGIDQFPLLLWLASIWLGALGLVYAIHCVAAGFIRTYYRSYKLFQDYRRAQEPFAFWANVFALAILSAAFVVAGSIGLIQRWRG